MSLSTAALMVQLYEQQVDLLQGHIQLLKQHLANPEATTTSTAVPATGKDGKKKKGSNKDSAEPKKKRPLSGFQLFMKEQLHEKKTGGDVTNNPKETLTRISKIWKEISDTDRGAYNKRAEKLKQDGVAEPVVAASSSSSSVEISTPVTSKKSEKKRKAESEPVVVAATLPVLASPIVTKKSAEELEDKESSHHKKKKKHHKHDGEKVRSI